ncbi:MAG: pyridoxamine 5'-phosphate oxidase family protein [Geothrix sp.]|jgi:hypothetical protein|uniref:Pyridoxamine 5'-phosphate oxidase family protein n=1 Tax=Candidatus Geothrix skivensis TaxID=2954439 RepID=A0A9D7SI09_9BACT|nr:pyridoxamine 5'-phosphate oxidase family protein [Holophagaceae bacterium]MBK9797243.1 pyridoxamine 5'-phosphate oxidase family protein [Candidatus Geothrix skivensis]
MIPDKMLQVLKCEGVVAVVTMGDNSPHVVNTWNSYLSITQDDQLLIPVGGMIQTEANVEKNPDIQITVGSREVDGFHGPGTGFLIKGSATFLRSGDLFDLVKARFPWIRATLNIKVNSATQTL